MPKSLRCKIKKLCYNGALTERERDRILKALEQQPCEDCISREAVLDLTWDWESFTNITRHDGLSTLREMRTKIEDLPSVTPKYIDEEIDKAQAVEQTYVDKMVELAAEESRKKWLNSFDTNSATKCFEAVNLLKQRLEAEE